MVIIESKKNNIDLKKINLRDSLIYIMDHYRNVEINTQNANRNERNKFEQEFIDFFTNDFKEYLSNLNNNFHVSHGFNSGLTKIAYYGLSFENPDDFYIYILFDYNLSSVYFTLGLKTSIITDESIKSLKNKFKELIYDSYNDENDFKLNEYEDVIDLGVESKINELNQINDVTKKIRKELVSLRNQKSKAKKYEDATLFAKKYEKNDLPSEIEIKTVFNNFFKLYTFIKEENIFDNINNNFNNNYKKDNNFNINKSFENFGEFLQEHGYKFNADLIENFLLSLKVKPFLIFTGFSGTGKTKLAQLFAKYLALTDNLHDEPNKILKELHNLDIELNKEYFNFNDIEDYNYQLIPVGANWTDNRNILGYYNIIDKKFSYTPTYILIKISSIFNNNPFFLILDEMNLSHVERYFSDFLSAIESNTRIPLYGKHEKLLIPQNLNIIGTVNIDETTYMFSPKVLDRANVIEFDNISVKSYMEDINYKILFKGDITFLENPLANIEFNDVELNVRQMNRNNIKDYFSQFDDNLWKNLTEELINFQEILQDSNFEMGYRCIDEIIRFMVVSKEYEKKNENFNWEHYFDVQIMQKILPKIHGSKNEIGPILNKLLKLCESKTDNEEDNNDKYEKSAIKIRKMIEILERNLYVSFLD